MSAVLDQRGAEFGKQVFGHVGRMAVAPQPLDQLLLLGDVAFALGNVVVHHLKFGRREGHAPL